LLAGGAHDDRSLRTLDNGFGSQTFRAKLLGLYYGPKAARKKLVLRLGGVGRFERPRAGLQGDTGNQIFAVLVVARMFLERKNTASGQAADIGLAAEDLVAGLEFAQPSVGEPLAVFMLGVLARIIEDFVLSLAVFAGHAGGSKQRSLGLCEIEILQGANYWLHLFLQR